MQAFILETLHCRGWRRGGETYWTQAEAEEAGRALIRQKYCRAVRVLPVEVELRPVAELPKGGKP